MSDNKPIIPIYFGDPIVFDEKGSDYLALRKIQWVNDEKDADPAKANLEIRNFYVKDGVERCGKGTKFLTEDGPDKLAEALVSQNYGNTRKIYEALEKRTDFDKAISESDPEFVDVEGELVDVDEDEEKMA